jgi:uncharacterized iron-regulated membrane protein
MSTPIRGRRYLVQVPRGLTRLAFKVHGWVGLASALLMLVVALSGAVLVFAAEINQVLWRDLTFVRPGAARLSYAALHEAVRVAHPGAHQVNIARFPPARDRSVVFDVATRSAGGSDRFVRLFVDPYTGRVLGRKDGAGGFREDPMRWLYGFHFTLMAGRPGYVAVAVLGVLLLVSLATGLIVYRRFVVRALLLQVRVRWRDWRRGISDLHRVVGVWAWLFNLVLAGTGLWFMRGVFTPDFYRDRDPGPPRPVTPVLPLQVSIDGLLERARQQVPDFVARGMFLGEDEGRARRQVVFYGDDRRKFLLLGSYDSQVRFDAETGALVGAELISRAPAARRLASATGPLHFGSWGGLRIKAVYAACALAPPLLAVTGFALWLRRRRGSRQGPDLD